MYQWFAVRTEKGFFLLTYPYLERQEQLLSRITWPAILKLLRGMHSDLFNTMLASQEQPEWLIVLMCRLLGQTRR